MGTGIHVLILAVLGVNANIFAAGEDCVIYNNGVPIEEMSEGIGLLSDVGKPGELIRQYNTSGVQSITVGSSKYLDVTLMDDVLSITFTAAYQTWEVHESSQYNQPQAEVQLQCSDGGTKNMLFFGYIHNFTNGYDPEFQKTDEFRFVIPMPFPAGLSVTLNFGDESNKIVVIDYDRNENDSPLADVTFDLEGDGSELFEIRTTAISEKQYTAELWTKKTLQLKETLTFKLIATDNDNKPAARSSYATIVIEPDVSTVPTPPPTFQEPLYTINVTESEDLSVEVFFKEGYDQDKTNFRLSHRSGEDLTSYFVAEKSSALSAVVKNRSEIPNEVLEGYFGLMLLEARTEGVAEAGRTVIQVLLPGSNPVITTTTESTTESTTTTTTTESITTDTTTGTTESSTSDPGSTESSTTDSSTTESSTSDPGSTESSTTDSSTTESSTSDPGSTESSTTDSSTTESSTSDPGSTESSTTDSSTTVSSTSDPGSTESSTTDSSITESSTSDPGSTESSTTDSSTTESSTSDPSSTESSTTDSSTTETSTSDPGSTESSTSDPGSTESSTSDPGSTESSTSDPGSTESSTTDSSTTESSTSDPGSTESSTTDSSTTESSTSDPGSTESSTSDPGSTESSTSDPGSTESSTSDPGSTESSTTDSSTTESSTSDPGSTESSTTDSSTTESSTSDPGSTESSTTDSSTTESSTSDPGSTSTTDSSTTESSTSDPGSTESSTTDSSTTESSTSDPGSTESSTTDSSTTESSTSDPGSTESSTTGSSTTESSTSDPGSTESSTTDSSTTESSTSDPGSTESSTTDSSTTESSTSDPGSTESSTSDPSSTESSTSDPGSTTDSNTTESSTSDSNITDPTSPGTFPTETPTTIVENLWDYTVLVMTLKETNATSVPLGYTEVTDIQCNFSLEVDPPEATSLFTIDASGTVSTAAPIDRESKIFAQSNIVRLKLFRTCDNPAHSKLFRGTPLTVGPPRVEYNVTGEENAMLLVVKVEDVNDNRPFFREKSLTVGYPSKDLVLEILPPSLVTVQAVDLDIGENAKIEYMIGGSRKERDDDDDDDDDHDHDHDHDDDDDDSNIQFVVHKDTGVVYPRQRTFRYKDTSFSVAARDSVGVGGSIQINVRILKKKNMAVIYQEGSTLEDTQKVLQSLQKAAKLNDVLAISAAVVADDKMDRRGASGRRDESHTLLRLVVYGIDDKKKLVPASTIIRAADDSPGVVKAEQWRPSSAAAEANTGLLIPVIILGVLLLISAVAMAFLVYRLRHPKESGLGTSSRVTNSSTAWWRKPMMIRNCFGSSYEAFSGTSSKQPSVSSVDAGISNNTKSGVIQLPTMNIERETSVVDGSAAASTDSNRSSFTLENTTGESDDSITQDEGKNSTSRRKSLVTFNENVEQIEIEKF